MRDLLIICHEWRWLTVNIRSLGTTKINKNNFDKMSYRKNEEFDRMSHFEKKNVFFDEMSYSTKRHIRRSDFRGNVVHRFGYFGFFQK